MNIILYTHLMDAKLLFSALHLMVYVITNKRSNQHLQHHTYKIHCHRIPRTLTQQQQPQTTDRTHPTSLAIHIARRIVAQKSPQNDDVAKTRVYGVCLCVCVKVYALTCGGHVNVYMIIFMCNVFVVVCAVVCCPIFLK